MISFRISEDSCLRGSATSDTYYGKAGNWFPPAGKAVWGLPTVPFRDAWSVMAWIATEVEELHVAGSFQTSAHGFGVLWCSFKQETLGTGSTGDLTVLC